MSELNQNKLTGVPEFTWFAVILGILLALILGAANTYLGLYAGMTVSASIPAAVISMGILRGLLKRGSILENNIVQTIASTGESLAAGIIFTIPALVIVGIWSSFDYWTVTLVALFGGVLGILFMIPMRKSLIIEEKMLKYPEGTACAEVLKAGEGEKTGFLDIVVGIFIGAGLKFFISGVAIIKGVVEGAVRLMGTVFYAGSDISAALLGVGAIVGLNVSLLMFTGGALGWLLAIPIVAAGKDASVVPLDLAWDIWSADVRYIGVGAMIVAGLWSIVKIRKGISSGFKELVQAYDKSSTLDTSRVEKNMSTRAIIAVMSLVVFTMFIFFFFKLGSFPITIVSIILVLVLSLFLVAVASYICGLVGSSNSPVSGMTICALLVTSLIFYIMGLKGDFAILATLIVAGVICCATCTSGDISQDLKTGALVGATPEKQQIGELIGAIIPAFIFAPILILLHNAYGIGTGAPGALKAPQAALFAGLTGAIFGDKTMPWNMIFIGIALAIAIIVADEILAKKKTSFRLYPMPVAVGIYLPFSLAIPVLAGGLIEFFVRKVFAATKEKQDKAQKKLILLSSGFIAGEALMGIFIALAITLVGYFAPNFKIPIITGVGQSFGGAFGIIVGLAIIGFLVFRVRKALK